jgi:predicted HTH transcriptional regulator
MSHGLKPHEIESKAQEVLERIRAGSWAKPACVEVGLAHRTWVDWLGKAVENEEAYIRARHGQAEANAERIMELQDELEKTKWDETEGVQVNALKTAIASRQWMAKALYGKQWGDTQQVNVSGAIAHIDISQEFLSACARVGIVSPEGVPTIETTAEVIAPSERIIAPSSEHGDG